MLGSQNFAEDPRLVQGASAAAGGPAASIGAEIGSPVLPMDAIKATLSRKAALLDG